MDCLNIDCSKADILKKKDEYLPLIISSIKNKEEPKLIVDNVNYVFNFLSAFDVTVVNNELLLLIVPAIKLSLEKCFEDNILITTTTDDMDMLDLLKENLQTAINLLEIYKNLLEYFLPHQDLHLNYIKSLPATVAYSLSDTFRHCRESQDTYKNNFHSELLELFKIAQDVHSALLKMIEASVIEDEIQENLVVLAEFLDVLIDLGDILADVNVRCMVANWKGYTSITNKFSNILQTIIHTNMKKAICCLQHTVTKNITLFKETIETDDKSAAQSIKITNFLLKVILKLCDTFWNCLDKAFEPILRLSFTIYSYRGSIENMNLYENGIIKLFEPFLNKLCHEKGFLQILENIDVNSDSAYGYLRVLNNVLILFRTIDSKSEIDAIFNKMFESLELCFTELTFDLSGSSDHLYENLLVNSSALILLTVIENIEEILLSNVLQGNIWSCLLAIDIWCLILSTSPNTAVQTLAALIEFRKGLDFGLFTYRVENVKLNTLLKRIYMLLPYNSKKQVVFQYPPSENLTIWNILGYEDISSIEQRKIEQTHSCSLLTVDTFNGNINYRDFFTAVESLETVFSLTSELESKTSLVCDLWGFKKPPDNVLSNNIFRLFIFKLCKITKREIPNFATHQLLFIIDHLTVLGSEPEFKLLVTDIISGICLLHQQDYGPEQFKIFRLIACLIYPVILKNAASPVKLVVYDVIKQLNDSPLYNNIVKIVLQNAKHLQGEINGYLQRKIQWHIDVEYFQQLEKCNYRHTCIIWRRLEGNNKTKNFSADSSDFEVKSTKLRPIENVNECPPAKKCKYEETSDVSDAINSIKGEVKSLMNILKSEKITAKNASQLKIIISQLQSLL